MRRFVARRALKRVNEIRSREKLEPIEVLPVGAPRSARSCVLANALPGGVVARRIETRRGSYSHSFCSRLFIAWFDMGLYPAFSSYGLWGSEGKRRRMCETRWQTVQRKRAAKQDQAAKKVVAELRESEEKTFQIRQQLEAAIAREEQGKAELATERKISERLEKRLADQRRESAQRIAELEHESIPFPEAVEPVEPESVLNS